MPETTLPECWAIYRDLHFPRLQPKSRAEYRTAMGRALEALPCRPTTRAITEWHVGLVEREGLSKTYANFCLNVVQAVIRKGGALEGDAAFVAVANVRPYRVQPRRRCPPADLLDRVLPACRHEGERCWILLAGLGGLRRGELLGLRPHDYDPERGTLAVVRQRKVDHRKNHRPHFVRIDDETLRRSLEWTIAHPDAIAPRASSPRGYVFPWSKAYADRMLQRIREHLGRDAVRYLPPGDGWHVFRHWHGTQLARRGATLYELMASLGDASERAALSYSDDQRGESMGRASRLSAIPGGSAPGTGRGATEEPSAGVGRARQRRIVKTVRRSVAALRRTLAGALSPTENKYGKQPETSPQLQLWGSQSNPRNR